MRFICEIRVIFLFFFLTVSWTSIAQNQTLRFDHIGIEEGLSAESVSTILQDTKGYIWFGTWDGLNKYDGYSFTKYR